MDDNTEWAMKRYEQERANPTSRFGVAFVRMERADAALTELKAERDELRDENADLRLNLTTSGLLTRMQEANQNGYECGRSLAEAERFMLEKERDELKAENERLQLFCYDCEHLDGWGWCRESGLKEQRGPRDHPCLFSPSRYRSRLANRKKEST